MSPQSIPPCEQMQAIAYVPTLLRGMGEIKKAFRVGERQVKFWASQGAPIAVEGDGVKTRYSAELLRLQLWRETVSPFKID